MLDQLAINGFRCFSSFQISGLRRLNLISGKNSVGKSALLEAIQFYLRPDLDSLVDLLDWRGQLVPSRQLPVWTEETVQPLFHSSLTDRAQQFEFASSDRRIRCRLAFHQRNADDAWVEAPDNTNGAPRRRVLRVEAPGAGREPYFFLPLDGSIEFHESPSGARRASQAFLRYAKAAGQRVLHARAVPFDSDVLSEMLESLLGTERHDDVMRVLQWIVPDAISAFTKGQGDVRSIYLQTGRFADPQPLASFGDGAVRLTGISLAMILAKDGYCLIDEIENGIHYTLFRKLWPLLNRISRELNVQVFASTHSKDCLEAFEETSADTNFDAAFFRLERSDGGGIEAVRLDYENFFSRVTGTPYEVR